MTYWLPSSSLQFRSIAILRAPVAPRIRSGLTGGKGAFAQTQQQAGNGGRIHRLRRPGIFSLSSKIRVRCEIRISSSHPHIWPILLMHLARLRQHVFQLLTGGQTIGTEHPARRAADSATLPSKKSRMLLCPCEPTAMRSAGHPGISDWLSQKASTFADADAVQLCSRMA